jgi:hypothetical protein
VEEDEGQLDPGFLKLKGLRLGLLLWRNQSRLMQQLSPWAKGQLARGSIKKKTK